MNRLAQSLAFALTLCAVPASAGIIGMLWSNAHNNVGIRASMYKGHAVVRVNVPSQPPCGLQLYRKEESELAAKQLQPGKDGAPVLALGLWMSQPCLFAYYDLERSKRAVEAPMSRLIDLDGEIFSRPEFAQHKAPFYQGKLKLAFCLQQSGPGDSEQNVTCPSVSVEDAREDNTVYQSKYVALPPVDLGLEAPAAVDSALRFGQVGTRPTLSPGQSPVKWPTLTARVRAFTVELRDAYASNGTGDFRYHRFFLYQGSLVGLERAKELARSGQVFCEMVLTEPKEIWDQKQMAAHLQAQSVPVTASGGSALFSDDKELDAKRYWSEHMYINPSFTSKAATDRVAISHFSCATPNGNRGDNKHVTVAQMYEHLRLDGEPLLKLVTDYPAHQAAN